MEPQRFPPDLLHRVLTLVEREGYCIFGAAEVERLFAHVGGSHAVKERFLEEFAVACGAEVETTPHFTSARFVKTAPKRLREREALTFPETVKKVAESGFSARESHGSPE